MSKDTTVGARIDTELKEKAQETFDRMGLPMSLGIELFLRQVADTGKLPFALAADSATDSSEKRLKSVIFGEASFVGILTSVQYLILKKRKTSTTNI